MSYALIDNASLTAVDRVTGRILVKNPDTINGDLVAFENVIQAILFYDNLVCIDNYKPEHREARINTFDYIRFLPQDDLGLTKVDQLAKNEAQQIKPELRGGEFVDEDFKKLVEMLKLNMICTWDMRSSVYYLTLKMLGQPYSPEYDKYSELSASIFNELSDVGDTKGRWSTDVKLVSSDGHLHTIQEMEAQTNGYGGVTRSLEMFIASLNWLAYKSIYYSMAAKHLKADSFLHPIRHAYQMHWMSKTGTFGHDYSSKLIKNLSNKISTTTSEILDHGRTSSISMDLPIFSAWLTIESGGINNVIKAALELKKSDQFVTAREVIREIKIAYDEDGIATANSKVTKLIRELDKITGDIKRDFGIPSAQGIQGSFLIKSINGLTALAGIPPLPDGEFALSTPEFMKSQRTKAFSTIFKDVTNELTSIERLGGIRDSMASSFNIDDEYYVPPKTEDPRYRGATSSWKIPM
ncbi:MAG: hypothetical protein AB7C96_09915 [Hydrogenovibrio sp.]